MKCGKEADFNASYAARLIEQGVAVLPEKPEVPTKVEAPAKPVKAASAKAGKDARYVAEGPDS